MAALVFMVIKSARVGIQRLNDYNPAFVAMRDNEYEDCFGY